MIPSTDKIQPTGPSYLVHLPYPEFPKFVYCGRHRAAVNSYPDGYVSRRASEEKEQTCRPCIKALAFARKTERSAT